METVWHVHPTDPLRSQVLARDVDVHPLTAQLLLNRGVIDSPAAARFLRPSLQQLNDPATLPEMERAVGRLRRAIARREPILIFSDSDVDGLTASVILYEVLSELGAVVRARQANRISDGYGLPHALIRQIARSAAKVVILVDCGTNQPEEIRLLREHGIDTIVVDHHVPLEGWAHPHAMVNPYRHEASGHRELSSAGLAFKLAQALFEDEAQERLPAYLDLAALGLLADCSPLIGESRLIVSEGLARIVQSARAGLQRLCTTLRMTQPEPEHILRRLVPKLNASGRLGDASAVWHLLRGDGYERMEEWVRATEAAHTETKQLHREVMAQAQEQVNRLHFRDQFVLVVSRTGWPQGLMGPLASQLAQRYGRPAIAIAMNEERGTGSGRSVPRFNLLSALQACQELLVRFGGHAQACGLTVDRRQMERFRALINQQAQISLGREGLQKTRMIDLELPLQAVSSAWVQEAGQFAPFGQGNPRPTVVIRGVTLEAKSVRTATLSDGRARLAAKGHLPTLATGARYDVVVSPTVLEGELTLTVSDVRDAAAPWAPARTSGTAYTRTPD